MKTNFNAGADLWRKTLGADAPPLGGTSFVGDPQTFQDVLSLAIVTAAGGINPKSELTTIFQLTEISRKIVPKARQEALAIIETAKTEYAAVAATWEGETDNERLTGLFVKLNETGMIACENLGQSLNDGAEKIDLMLEKAERKGRKILGTVFYHAQDLERAIAGHGLMLAFWGESRGAAIATGKTLVAVLQSSGFKPIWNGSPHTRIQVPIEWRRRPTA